jgi:hypothetical protein
MSEDLNKQLAELAQKLGVRPKPPLAESWSNGLTLTVLVITTIVSDKLVGDCFRFLEPSEFYALRHLTISR